MIQPIENMANLRLNRTLHGRSVHRKQNVSGHNVVRYYNKSGKGDGIDLFAPAGTPVVAAHYGVITRVFDRQGKLSGCYIDGKNRVSVYAHLHLKDCIRVGYAVKMGEVVGYVGKVLQDPHLHFELENFGHVITGETPEGMLKHLLEVIDT